jgi:hypothetical protein
MSFLLPLGDKVAALVENLDAVVGAVGDKQAAGGIEGERMVEGELAGAGAALWFTEQAGNIGRIKMRVRRETVEHPFGTLRMRMGATHFLMKRLPKVATEIALHVLAYNLTRVMNIVGVKPLIAAIQT